MHDSHCILASSASQAIDLVDYMRNYSPLILKCVRIWPAVEWHSLELAKHTTNYTNERIEIDFLSRFFCYTIASFVWKLPQVTDDWNVFGCLIVITILEHAIISSRMPCGWIA